jgi:O-6-methylguanine DNA methyltransferase
VLVWFGIKLYFVGVEEIFCRWFGLFEVYIKFVDGVWFGVACESGRVFGTSFAGDEQEVLRDLLGCLPFDVGFEVVGVGSAFAEKAVGLVKQVYDGADVVNNLGLAIDGLPVYSQRVLRAVSLIPVGYITSYGAVAKAVGGGARAVGNIMASNRFAPLVPCHRVVSADLGLGGYSGGIDVKVKLLKREKRGYTKPRDVAVDGEKKLQVVPVEFVLKKLVAHRLKFANLYLTL